MKILYKPFAIDRPVDQRPARPERVPDRVGQIDDASRPSATTAEATLPKVVGAAALEAATMAASRPPSTAAAPGRSTTSPASGQASEPKAKSRPTD